MAGGASVARQAFATWLADELHLHVAPVLLGAGMRLFADAPPSARLEPERVIESPAITHVRYRVRHGRVDA